MCAFQPTRQAWDRYLAWYRHFFNYTVAFDSVGGSSSSSDRSITSERTLYSAVAHGYGLKLTAEKAAAEPTKRETRASFILVVYWLFSSRGWGCSQKERQQRRAPSRPRGTARSTTRHTQVQGALKIKAEDFFNLSMSRACHFHTLISSSFRLPLQVCPSPRLDQKIDTNSLLDDGVPALPPDGGAECQPAERHSDKMFPVYITK